MPPRQEEGHLPCGDDLAADAAAGAADTEPAHDAPAAAGHNAEGADLPEHRDQPGPCRRQVRRKLTSPRSVRHARLRLSAGGRRLGHDLCGFPKSWRKWQLVDMDGDGRPDLVLIVWDHTGTA